jgi:LL-diaminopimelate aminotransferase
MEFIKRDYGNSGLPRTSFVPFVELGNLRRRASELKILEVLKCFKKDVNMNDSDKKEELLQNKVGADAKSPLRGVGGLSKRLNGIGEYYFSQKLREIDELNKVGKNIINLGIGPDLPPHPDVIKTLHEEAAKKNVHAYQSYKGSPILRKAISEWYKKWYNVELNSDTEVLPLIGSKEGIMHICMTYFEEGVSVLVPNPGYPTYSSAIKLSGATPVYYELKEENNYEPDFDQLENLVTEGFKSPLRGAGGLFVNYPNMPTGQLPSKELFEKLVKFGKKHNILIIHDTPTVLSLMINLLVY